VNDFLRHREQENGSWGQGQVGIFQFQFVQSTRRLSRLFEFILEQLAVATFAC
jgi:hypothetical protein